MLVLNKKGDTLIEVIFAISIFSLIAVGCLSIMNQGLYTAQRSLEITQVRQQIDSQAEALRFLSSSYIAAYEQRLTSTDYTGPAKQWSDLINSIAVADPATPFNNVATCPKNYTELNNKRRNSFIINVNTAVPTLLNASNFKQATSHAMAEYNADGSINTLYGLWIEAVSANIVSGAKYIDFHIRACWDTFGMSMPETIGTIVRLYVP
jgi:type II secretory pathway pseudopilin PulG